MISWFEFIVFRRDIVVGSLFGGRQFLGKAAPKITLRCFHQPGHQINGRRRRLFSPHGNTVLLASIAAIAAPSRYLVCGWSPQRALTTHPKRRRDTHGRCGDDNEPRCREPACSTTARWQGGSHGLSCQARASTDRDALATPKPRRGHPGHGLDPSRSGPDASLADAWGTSGPPPAE